MKSVRLRFPDSSDTAEQAARRSLLEASDAVWERFESVVTAGAEAVTGDDELRCRLGAVERALHLDVDGVTRPRTLTITPETERRLQPLADAVVARAPRTSGWSFASKRGAVDLERALARVRVETGVDLSSARARAGFQRGHLLDVVVHSEHCTGLEDEVALDAAYVAVEAILGEALLHDWIGSVSVSPQPKPGPLRVMGAGDGEARLALAELSAAIHAAVDGVTAELPDVPMFELADRGDWTMLEMDAESADDYPGHADRVLATTRLPEMLKCFLEGSPFCSRRFSTCGERFCAVKTAVEGTPEQRLRERQELEDSLGRALRESRAGAVVGGGLGITYAYVDLALADVDAGAEIVREVGRARGLPRRSWLSFFDDEWADEWVALAPGSPPPPGQR